MKSALCACGVTCLIIVTFYSIGNGQWIESNEGLYGGHVNSFLMHNDTLYAGTYGGVYRSINKGASWDRINDGINNSVHVNDFIECGGKIFLAINGSYGLYALADNRLGWTLANNGLPASAIIDLVSISGILIAQTNQGELYKSTDLANSWQPLPTSFGYISSIASTGSTLIVGTPNGIYVSSDFGQTWMEKSFGLPSKNIFSLAGTSNYLICWVNGGIYFSANAANSWKPTEFQQDYFKLTNKGTTVIARSNSASYISKNGGLSWSSLDQVPNGIASIITDEGILAGTVYGIYRSTDGGVTWGSSNIGLKNNTAYAFAEGFGFLFIATQNGVYRSADKGLTWSASGSGLPVGTVWSLAVEGDLLLAGFYENGIYASSNGGNTWTKVSNALGVRSFVKYKERLLAGSFGGIYQSVTGGLSWTLLTSNLIYINDMVAHDTRLWACTFTGVAYTEDGVTWINANGGLPSMSTLPFSLFEYSNHLLLGTINNSVYKSNNANEPWQYAGNGITKNEIRSFESNDTALYAGGDGGVFITHDTGASWSSLNDGFPTYITNAVESLHTQKGKLFASPNSFGVWVWSSCITPATPMITESTENCRDVLLTSNSDTGNEWHLDGVAISGANEKELRPIAEGNYSLRVIEEGCPSVFSDPVQVLFIPELSIEMPNVFTPNGDELNDFFVPMKLEGVKLANLVIYNRWGKEVFTSTDLLQGWNGGECTEGVYYYTIRIQGICNESKTITGWIQLIR